MSLLLGLTAASLSVGSLGLDNRTRNALQRAGLDTLQALIECSGPELVRLRGLGAESRKRLEHALEEVATGLPASESARIEELLAEVSQLHAREKYLPARPRAEPPPAPADLRRLVTGLESLRHRPSVEIMKHRLGLNEGGARQEIQETVQALGVTRNAVTLADFRVTHWLRGTRDFELARWWLAEALEAGGGLATQDELEAHLDPGFPVRAGELAAALRLLDRVEGRSTGWQSLADGTVVANDHLGRLRELAAESERANPCPVPLASLASWLSDRLGGAAARGWLHSDRAARIVEQIWGGTVWSDRQLLVSYSARSSLRQWASAVLYLETGPLKQGRLGALLAELPCGKPEDVRTLWAALASEPRIIKTAPQTWCWLSRLEVGEGQVRAWTERCRELLQGAGGALQTATLRLQLGEAQPSTQALSWILKRDPRFRVEQRGSSVRLRHLETA